MSSKKLESKLAKNRARGQRTPANLEQAILSEYSDMPEASYRTLAAKHGIGVGTVMRIVHRAGLVVAEDTGAAVPRVDLPALLREAAKAIDAHTGTRKALVARIRDAVGE